MEYDPTYSHAFGLSVAISGEGDNAIRMENNSESCFCVVINRLSTAYVFHFVFFYLQSTAFQFGRWTDQIGTIGAKYHAVLILILVLKIHVISLIWEI